MKKALLALVALLTLFGTGSVVHAEKVEFKGTAKSLDSTAAQTQWQKYADKVSGDFVSLGIEGASTGDQYITCSTATVLNVSPAAGYKITSVTLWSDYDGDTAPYTGAKYTPAGTITATSDGLGVVWTGTSDSNLVISAPTSNGAYISNIVVEYEKAESAPVVTPTVGPDKVFAIESSVHNSMYGYNGSGEVLTWTSGMAITEPLSNEEISLMPRTASGGTITGNTTFYIYNYTSTLTVKAEEGFVIKSVKFGGGTSAPLATTTDANLTRTTSGNAAIFTGDFSDEAVFTLPGYTQIYFIEVTYYDNGTVVHGPKKPVIKLPLDEYAYGTEVEVTAGEGEDIYYSLSTDNSENWTLCNGTVALNVEGLCTLKVKAVKDGLESKVVEQQYIVTKSTAEKKGYGVFYPITSTFYKYNGAYADNKVDFVNGTYTYSNADGVSISTSTPTTFNGSYGIKLKNGKITITPAPGTEVCSVKLGGNSTSYLTVEKAFAANSGLWRKNTDASYVERLGSTMEPIELAATGDTDNITWIEVVYRDVVTEGNAENPAIGLESGDYVVGQQVVITTAQTNATLEYSYDGENWMAYKEPIVLNEPGKFTIYARAKYGDSYSEVVSNTYNISYEDVAAPVFSVAAGNYEPTLSLAITAAEGCTIKYKVGEENTWKAYTAPITFDTKGTYTVTAQAFKGVSPSEEATLTFTINHTLAKLSFSAAEASVVIGKSFTAPAFSNAQNVAVVWTSSNPEVATVDQTGAVTILAEGSTTITAAFEGNEEFAAASASYKLTVDGMPKSGKWVNAAGETITEFELELAAYNAASDDEKAAMLPEFKWNIPLDGWAYCYSSNKEAVETVAGLWSPFTLTVVGTGVTTLYANSNNGKTPYIDGYSVEPLLFTVKGAAGITSAPKVFITSMYANAEGAEKQLHKFVEGYPVAPNDYLSFETEEGSKLFCSINNGAYFEVNNQLYFEPSDVGTSFPMSFYATKDGQEDSEVVTINVTVKNWVIVDSQEMFENNSYFLLASNDKVMLNNGNQAANGEGTAMNAAAYEKAMGGRTLLNSYDAAILEKEAGVVFKVFNAPSQFENTPYLNLVYYQGSYFVNYNTFAQPLTVTINEATSEASIVRTDGNYAFGYNEKDNVFSLTGKSPVYLYAWADASNDFNISYTLNGEEYENAADFQTNLPLGSKLEIEIPMGFVAKYTMAGEEYSATGSFTINFDKEGEIAVVFKASCDGVDKTFEFNKTFNVVDYKFGFYLINGETDAETAITSFTTAADGLKTFKAGTLRQGDRIRVVAPEGTFNFMYSFETWENGEKVTKEVALSNSEVVLSFDKVNNEYTYNFSVTDDRGVIILNNALNVVVLASTGGYGQDLNVIRFNVDAEDHGNLTISTDIENLYWLSDENAHAENLYQKANSFRFIVPKNEKVAIIKETGLYMDDNSMVRFGLDATMQYRLVSMTITGSNLENIKVGEMKLDNTTSAINQINVRGEFNETGSTQLGESTLTWTFDPTSNNISYLEIWNNPSAARSASRKAVAAGSETAPVIESIAFATDMPTAVDAINANGETMWFDMQGNRVDGQYLNAGIYIRIENGKANKVLVK